MNPRIQELAEQAERLARDELAHLERVHNRLYSLTEGREIYNEKFALLIIQECANLFEVEWGEEKLTGNDVGYVVKKHFGVERD
jgi:uncharacterized protein YhbP (UPF0306 family)